MRLVPVGNVRDNCGSIGRAPEPAAPTALCAGVGGLLLVALATLSGCADDECSSAATCVGAASGGPVTGANSDGGDGGDDPATLTGPAFTFQAIAAQPRIMHDSSLTLKLAITRVRATASDIAIAVTGLPEGVSAEPVSIKGGETTSDLVIKVSAAARQGPFEATIDGTTTTEGESVATKLPLFVRGKPGVVDTTFGTDGRRLAVLGAGATSPREILVDAQDRIHVIGECGATSCVARMTADGASDAAFAGGGVASLSVPKPQSAALDSVGRVVVGGGNPLPVVGRLLATGLVDTTFAATDGGGGGVTASLEPADGNYKPATAVVSLAVGREDVVFATFGANRRGGLSKLNAAGARVSTFGTGGFVPVLWGATEQVAGVLAFGEIVTVAGSWDLGLGDIEHGLGISRFDANSGARDAAFGTTELRDHEIEGWDSLSSVPGTFVPLPDGRWLFAHTRQASASVTKYLSAFSADGKRFAPDFGSTGHVTITPAGTISRLARQADGKILVTVAASSKDVLLRFGASGAPDATFGSSGVLTLAPMLTSTSRCVAVQSDGRIVLASSESGSQTTYVTRIWD